MPENTESFYITLISEPQAAGLGALRGRSNALTMPLDAGTLPDLFKANSFIAATITTPTGPSSALLLSRLQTPTVALALRHFASSRSAKFVRLVTTAPNPMVETLPVGDLDALENLLRNVYRTPDTIVGLYFESEETPASDDQLLQTTYELFGFQNSTVLKENSSQLDGFLKKWRGGKAGPVTTTEALEARNRHAVLAARKTLLQTARTLTSEELATRRESISANPSQLGADLRKNGKAFAVRHGKQWLYPAFQFDPKGNPLPAMGPILAALGEDERGWDTLQWFLTPHETLSAETPLARFQNDPGAVLDAARKEHWRARD